MAKSTKSREPKAAAVAPKKEAKVAQPKAVKATKPCECGCGTQVPRRFAPGHDGRLKGQLLRTLKAARLLGDKEAAASAEAKLAALGWAKFIPAE